MSPPFSPRSPSRCFRRRLFHRAVKKGEKRAAVLTAHPRTVKNRPPFSPRSPSGCQRRSVFESDGPSGCQRRSVLESDGPSGCQRRSVFGSDGLSGCQRRSVFGSDSLSGCQRRSVFGSDTLSGCFLLPLIPAYYLLLPLTTYRYESHETILRRWHVLFGL